MSSSDILTHVEGGVMTVTLNRLDRKNSITSAMYGAMADALAAADTDASIRVAVVQGHETVFSAGNDIGDFLNKPPAAADSPVFRFLRGIATFSKPLLAAVCGPAVGVGTTMLFHCEPFMAEAALEVGLVNRVVPPMEANGVVQAAARKLAAKPLASLVETKRLMKKGQQQLVLQQMADEGLSFSRLLGEPAAREAFGAFMDKRKPDFSKL
jgi:enoyl-CoA hydratase/carnithine racemase